MKFRFKFETIFYYLERGGGGVLLRKNEASAHFCLQSIHIKEGQSLRGLKRRKSQFIGVKPAKQDSKKTTLYIDYYF